MINDKNMKSTVQAVILNEKGEILAVSRKTDHNDFGLPGGKVDPEDETIENAIAREVLEETGLIIDKSSLHLIFAAHRDGHMGYTFLVNHWWGDINYNEPHVVKWTSFMVVEKGSFGRWNKDVHECLKSMNVFVVSDYYDDLLKELIPFINTTKHKSWDTPFKFNGLKGPTFGFYHLIIEEEPDALLDHDDDYNQKLDEIGKKYDFNLKFPYHYYSK